MLKRSMLSDQVRETLLERIMDGTVKQGDRLVESQIAKELGVSQSPVRAALRELTAMRFVEQVPFKGARVRTVADEELAATYPVRAALERLAGQLAAPKLKGNTAELEDIYVQMQAAAEAGNAQLMARLDADFHRHVIEAAGNRILAETWDALNIEARTYITAVRVIRTRAGLKSVADMHRDLIDALDAGDAARAGDRMCAHVTTFANILKERTEEWDSVS